MGVDVVGAILGIVLDDEDRRSSFQMDDWETSWTTWPSAEIVIGDVGPRSAIVRGRPVRVIVEEDQVVEGGRVVFSLNPGIGARPLLTRLCRPKAARRSCA